LCKGEKSGALRGEYAESRAVDTTKIFDGKFLVAEKSCLGHQVFIGVRCLNT
jgi:hypothetical protein